MYNFKDVVMDAENMWNAGKEGLCTELHKALDASDILAMTSRSRASKSRKRTDSSISRLAVPLGRQGYTIYKYSTTVRAFWRIRMSRVLIYVPFLAQAHRICHRFGRKRCIEMYQ